MKCSFNGVTCKKSEWNVTTDTEREGTASSGRRCGGVLGSSKKEKEFMDMDNSVVIAGGRVQVEVEKGTGGINDNEKNTIRMN